MTKGYGFSVADIDNSNPHDLEPYRLAHDVEQKQQDTQVWLMCGNYVVSAVATAVEHCLAGRKARSKFIKEPILYTMNHDSEEEKLQKQREKFLAGLLAMQANFEINHPKKQRSESEVIN